MAKQEKSKPIKTFRAGGIQASVWRDETEKDGQTVVQHSVRIQKQFRKEDGSYADTQYYFQDDLPKLVLVAQKAFEFISLKSPKDTEEATPG